MSLTTQALSEREALIRKLAYEIWENEGHPAGRDKDHWEQAARMVEAEEAPARNKEAGRARRKATTSLRRTEPALARAGA